MLCLNLPVFCLFKHDVKAFGTWNTTFKSLLCLFCPGVSCSAVYWRWLWGLPVQASGPAGTTHLMVQCFFWWNILCYNLLQIFCSVCWHLLLMYWSIYQFNDIHGCLCFSAMGGRGGDQCAGCHVQVRVTSIKETGNLLFRTYYYGIFAMFLKCHMFIYLCY